MIIQYRSVRYCIYRIYLQDANQFPGNCLIEAVMQII